MVDEQSDLKKVPQWNAGTSLREHEQDLRTWAREHGDDRVAVCHAEYEKIASEHRRLVRELDIALNGEEEAAPQASLCDVVGQVVHIRKENGNVPILKSRTEDAATWAT